jgi:hypothetical protein
MNDPMTSGHLRGGLIERPRYYARQLITPAELNLEAAYFVERLRRHNRLLHGWGVVCGALVCRVPAPEGGAEPWKIRVTPGHLLDQFGNDIEIVAERIVDLRAGGVTVTPHDPAGELSDPWCSEVWTEPERNEGWVAVRYHQSMARPVRVQPAGCDCDDSACEYSRWCDGYEVRLLDGCPPSHQGDPPSPDDVLAPGPIPDCPEPTDPWVVLARVAFDDDGTITEIDNCACRRMVLSLAGLWWRCQARQLTVANVTAEPAEPQTPGTQGIKLTVKGSGLDPAATAELGPGVRVTTTEVPAADTMVLTVRILKSAKPGDRMLVVTNPDCTFAKAAKALTVAPPAAKAGRAKGRRA